MAAGEKASVDVYYEWPGQSENLAAEPLAKQQLAQLSTAVTQAGLVIRGLPDGSFGNLSPGLQRKFMDAGLSPEHGIRTAAEAQALYQETVPTLVCSFGESAVRDFLGDKHFSHIHSKAPTRAHLARNPTNGVWETPAANLKRGAADMTPRELFGANSTNTLDASMVVMRHCMKGAASAAFTAALLEAPVAGHRELPPLPTRTQDR